MPEFFCLLAGKKPSARDAASLVTRYARRKSSVRRSEDEILRDMFGHEISLGTLFCRDKQNCSIYMSCVRYADFCVRLMDTKHFFYTITQSYLSYSDRPILNLYQLVRFRTEKR